MTKLNHLIRKSIFKVNGFLYILGMSSELGHVNLVCFMMKRKKSLLRHYFFKAPALSPTAPQAPPSCLQMTVERGYSGPGLEVTVV